MGNWTRKRMIEALITIDGIYRFYRIGLHEGTHIIVGDAMSDVLSGRKIAKRAVIESCQTEAEITGVINQYENLVSLAIEKGEVV